MKELDHTLPEDKKEKTEIHAQAPVRDEQQHAFRFRNIPRGVKIWECDPKTGICTQVEINSTAIEYREDAKVNNYVGQGKARKGFLYVQAVNRSNAERKLRAEIQNLRTAYINHVKEVVSHDVQPDPARSNPDVLLEGE